MKGIEVNPRINPMAWDAPSGPQIWTAIGPSKAEQHPSNTPRIKENAINEIRILASVRHPNVICYKEAFWEKNSSSQCIIMEHADDEDQIQKISMNKKKGKI